MEKALKYLRQLEWSMANYQCPDCNGISEKWYGTISCCDKDEIGHYKECRLADALSDMGEDVIIKGSFKPEIEYELIFDTKTKSFKIAEKKTIRSDLQKMFKALHWNMKTNYLENIK